MPPECTCLALFPQERFILHPWLQAVPTLIKPFKSAELLATVERVLSASDATVSKAHGHPRSNRRDDFVR
jgi:hypothetical protein